MAEDCLHLNVTVPRHASARRPVLVWIHGGGFQWGSGGIYGAERLAERGDVAVVTINYRLNVFGFLAHPALDGGPARFGSGNLGVEDQQAAMRWVRRNAAAFGGDPSNVTIAGESAGAQVSCTHLTAPGSRGLFDRVIMQSGPGTMPWPYGDPWRAKPRQDAETIGQAVAAKAGCTDPATAADCLRSKTPGRAARGRCRRARPRPDPGRGVRPDRAAVPRAGSGTDGASAQRMSAEPVRRLDRRRAVGAADRLGLGLPGGRDQRPCWFAGPAAPACPTGAFHAGELQYLFSGAYVGLPYWPRHRATGTGAQALAPGVGGIRQVDFRREHRCGFWSSL